MARLLYARCVSLPAEAAAHRVRQRRRRYNALADSLEEAIGGATDAEDFIAALRDGADARFITGPHRGDAVVEVLRRRVPGWDTHALADANRILEGRLRILQVSDLEEVRPAAADGLPWHRDVVHDFQWHRGTYHRRIRVPYGRADIKMPWELSRCQHLPALAIAYRVSGDRRFAKAVVNHVVDWVDSNPVGYGVNWMSPMELGIRLVNWIWAYQLIADAPEAHDDFIATLAVGLLDHAAHIDANIEVYRGGVTTNHTVADFLGLLHAGLFLQGAPQAAAWVGRGRDGLVDCMRTQVGDEGVDFENSIPYHRFVLEMFLSGWLVARRHGVTLPEDYTQSLEAMFDFVAAYTRPDGLAPIVGDNDDGRLQILDGYRDWQTTDHRYLLEIGGRLFDRPDLVAAAGGLERGIAEAAWHLGPEAVDGQASAPPAPPIQLSSAFPRSGRYIMREGEHHALISADDVGSAGLGNHKHNDVFSYELSYAGEPVITDSGSYLYTSDWDARRRFRTTAYHSTVLVDGVEQNEITEWFGMRADARVSVERWDVHHSAAVFTGSHTGYLRLNQPALHRRTLVMLTRPFAWLVLDTVQGCGSHRVESFIQIAAGLGVSPADPLPTSGLDPVTRALEEIAGQTLPPPATVRGLRITMSSDLMIVPLGPVTSQVTLGAFAPAYGRSVPRPVIRLTGPSEPDVSFGYLIVPAASA